MILILISLLINLVVVHGQPPGISCLLVLRFGIGQLENCNSDS